MDYIKTTIDGLGDAHRNLIKGSHVKVQTGKDEILELNFITAQWLYQMSQGPVNTKHLSVDEKAWIAGLASQGLIIEDGNQYSGVYIATNKARNASYSIAPLYSDGTRYGTMAGKRPELTIEERLGINYSGKNPKQCKDVDAARFGADINDFNEIPKDLELCLDLS